MKKLLLLVMALFVASVAVVAQPKTSEKALWKQAKKQAKTMAKEGWKVDGSQPMENCLYNHLFKLSDPNYQEVVATVSGSTTVKTVNQGKQWARNMANQSYAKDASTVVKGRITGESGAGIDGAPSVDNFYEAYEALVYKSIQGELKMSFGVYRETKEGTIEYIGYYTVNEEEASKARIKAMQNAMKESEFARKHAEEIGKFVQAGFNE